MPAKPEAKYTTAVGKYLPREIYKWKINASFQNGVPDSYYSGDAADLWVEYKFLQNPPSAFLPNLSALQRKWINEQYDRGRKVAVVVGSPNGGVILQDKKWETRIQREELTLSKKEIAEWITSVTLRSTCSTQQGAQEV